MTLMGDLSSIKVDAVVDTGADLTLFPRSVATVIGAVVDDSIRWPVGGVGGQSINASPGVVQLEIADGASRFSWRPTVGFVDYPRPALELSILGHAAFLEYFEVLFDGPAAEVEIRGTSAFPGSANHPSADDPSSADGPPPG